MSLKKKQNYLKESYTALQDLYPEIKGIPLTFSTRAHKAVGQFRFYRARIGHRKFRFERAVDIRLSNKWIERCHLIDMEDILLHEVGHALSAIRYNEMGHGRVFKRVCKELPFIDKTAADRCVPLHMHLMFAHPDHTEKYVSLYTKDTKEYKEVMAAINREDIQI